VTSRKKLYEILLADRAESQRIHALREAIKIKTTKEERAEMGELGKKLRRRLDSEDPAKEYLDQIVAWFEDERERGRTDPDPLISARAIFAVHRTLDVLARNGFPQFSPLVYDMHLGIVAIAEIFRTELVRRLLLDLIPEPKASEAVAELSRWPDWNTHLDEVAAAIQWA
jgi:hypothetical protein